MKKIQDWFLRAQHWQLFLLLGVVPFVLELTTLFFANLIHFALVIVIAPLLWLAFFGSVGDFLGERARMWAPFNSAFFRVALGFPAVYLPFFLWYSTTPNHFPSLAILPLHLFSMFCVFYVLYFISKSLVTTETQREATFSAYAGTLILFWFLPLGIWVLQPRLNRLYSATVVS